MTTPPSSGLTNEVAAAIALVDATNWTVYQGTTPPTEQTLEANSPMYPLVHKAYESKLRPTDPAPNNDPRTEPERALKKLKPTAPAPNNDPRTTAELSRDFLKTLHKTPYQGVAAALVVLEFFNAMRGDLQRVPTSADASGYKDISDALAPLLDNHRTALGYPNKVSKDEGCSPSKRLVLMAGVALFLGKFATAGAAKRSFKQQSGNTTAEAEWCARLKTLETILGQRVANAPEQIESTAASPSLEPSTNSDDGSPSTGIARTAHLVALEPVVRKPWSLPVCVKNHESAANVALLSQLLLSDKNSQADVAAVMVRNGPPQHVNSWEKAWQLALEASIVDYVMLKPEAHWSLLRGGEGNGHRLLAAQLGLNAETVRVKINSIRKTLVAAYPPGGAKELTASLGAHRTRLNQGDQQCGTDGCPMPTGLRAGATLCSLCRDANFNGDRAAEYINQLVNEAAESSTPLAQLREVSYSQIIQSEPCTPLSATS